MMSPPPLVDEASALPATPDGVVYIVDDDAGVRSALQFLARCCGWRPTTFASGCDFLRAPLEGTSACVVLDLNMTGMDGEEVLRQLESRGSQLPVVVITGDRQGSRLDRARRLGARQVLLKPFGEEAFQAAVQNCLDLAGASE